MKLYTFPPSPNALRVQATAKQLGVELEEVMLNLGKGEQMQPSFIKLNPNHTIPTLEDGDVVLTDSMAIMIYLAEKHPDGGLIPGDQRDRMRMYQWMAWNLTMFGPACGTMLFERLVKGLFNLGEPDAKELAKAEERFHRFAKVLDDHLKGKDFIVGRNTTLADHAIGSQFVHEEAGAYPMDSYAEISRWWNGLRATDAWRKTLAQMQV